MDAVSVFKVLCNMVAYGVNSSGVFDSNFSAKHISGNVLSETFETCMDKYFK